MLQYEARLSPPKGELSHYRSRLKNYVLCDRDEFEARLCH